MKHANWVLPEDLEELERARLLVVDGKALRKRVMTRIRNRAYREKRCEK